MSYENAEATKFLATHCAACGRPLVDATSVEAGMGPVCRKKYAYEDAIEITPKILGQIMAALLGVEDANIRNKVKAAVNAGDSRKAANILVHHIAVLQKDPAAYPLIRAIKALGYDNLADRIEARMKPDIMLSIGDDGRISVKSPYHEGFIKAVKGIKGKKFDFEKKTWSVPEGQKAALWAALQEAFEGKAAMGPKGPFVVA